MPDQHSGRAEGLSSPANNAFAIEAADFDTDLPNITRFVYVGVTGDLVVVMQDDTEVTFRSVPAGTVLPIRIKQVLTEVSGSPTDFVTDAAGIIGLY